MSAVSTIVYILSVIQLVFGAFTSVHGSSVLDVIGLPVGNVSNTDLCVVNGVLCAILCAFNGVPVTMVCSGLKGIFNIAKTAFGVFSSIMTTVGAIGSTQTAYGVFYSVICIYIAYHTIKSATSFLRALRQL
jgi:uncharacterized membrane protein